MNSRLGATDSVPARRDHSRTESSVSGSQTRTRTDGHARLRCAWHRSVALCMICCALAGCGARIGHRGVVLDVETETVNVYYATDRAPETSDEPGVKYGWERAYLDQDQPYAVGVCQVEITRHRNHDQTPPLPRSHKALVQLVSTAPLEPSQFYDRIREDMWYAAADGLFVFVHGYNNSFEQAAKRSAEIWYDIGFDGPPIMFSWPSRGGSFWRGVFSYFADAETVEWSSIHLKAFLEELVAETTPEKLFADEPARIHLIAHSMGCRALTRALMLIGDLLSDRQAKPQCPVIGPGGEEGLANEIHVLRRYARTVVSHSNEPAIGIEADVDRDLTLVPHGIYGILEDVDERLLDALSLDVNRR